MVDGQFKVLKSFRYGNVSDPKRMIAGNTVSAAKFSEKQINQWIKLKWVEMV
jgi:hypothetical protein